ncbi:hypothetical protein Tco_0200905 [Tanacetum coccineum]
MIGALELMQSTCNLYKMDLMILTESNKADDAPGLGFESKQIVWKVTFSSGDENFGLILRRKFQKRKGLQAVVPPSYRSRVPQAVFHRSTGDLFIQGWINISLEPQAYSPSSGSTIGSQAVLPQTVKKNAMINPKQTWRPKGNYLDSVNRDNGSYNSSNLRCNSMRKKDLKDYAIIDRDKECSYLSPSFKCVDEDLAILRAPRKNDVYSLELRILFLSGGITCLVAKATEYEAVLCTGRLGMSTSK